MKNGHDGQNVPEKVGYTRYYEHDGMLRAYANRSMVLAMVFGVIALSSFAFAVYVRLQPPTVIRVDSEGEAAIVGGTPVPGHTRGLTFAASAADAAKVSPRVCPGTGVPPTIAASPSLSTRITVGGCRRTYTANAKELKAITPN